MDLDDPIALGIRAHAGDLLEIVEQGVSAFGGEAVRGLDQLEGVPVRVLKLRQWCRKLAAAPARW